MIDYPWFDPITQKLEAALKQARLPHAIVFQAPKGCAKKHYAKAVSKSLLCDRPKNFAQACGECKSCLLMESDSHPDYYLVDRLTDAKGKQKLSIGIDQIRELTAKLQESAQLGGYRICVIASVGSMTTSAFNALLKTLEEPGKQTVIFLLSDNAGDIPATIRSRCQIYTPQLTSKLVCEWVSKKLNESSQMGDENQQELISQAVVHCNHAPIASLAFIEKGGVVQKMQLSEHLDLILQGQKLPEMFLQEQDFDTTELLDFLANYFIECQKKSLLAAATPNNQPVDTKSAPALHLLPDQLIYQLYEKVLEIKRAIGAGSHLQVDLQVESLLIQWFEIGRKIHLNTKG